MAKKSYGFKSFLSSSLLVILLYSTAVFAQDGPGTEYGVRIGDMLSGISSSYSSAPLLWTEPWRKNPNLPYPDQIHQVTKVSSDEFSNELKIADPSGRLVTGPVSQAGFVPSDGKRLMAKADIEENPSVQPDNNDEAEDSSGNENGSFPAKKNYPPWSAADLNSAGFILKKLSDGKPKGEIVASENEHLLLGEGDVVYIVPKGSQRFKVGERYTIFAVVKSVHHPRTKRLLGKLIHIKGIVEIIENTMASPKDSYSAVIVKSYELIGLKDLITDYHPVDPISIVLNEAPYPNDLKGVVVAAREVKENNGEFDIVYLDKGSQDGVQVGHLLVVFKEGKKAPYYSPEGHGSLPRRVIGDLQVISVEKETSTAIVARSIEPILVGDQFSNPYSSNR